ncbi:TetR/AcrR family transcriptional regulator [Corynebacterium mendelii]|uniref:TetR/AcrR family transcriptional regulator n=1 Tax=Corynebacterium mendelii TaxID=2765362 RepID=A0A939DZ04_9CORY|nr:TetR/AcrR family transcriptional regulator [Corynebacterium mendelii]MBN9643854.1 TetR/AcrR family transcriptional regulator [Corynebacterium mendelii]
MHNRAETEAKLVDAARKVIVDAGFEGCTLERICSTAGFTRGAFYSNFTDKEALFTMLVKDEYNQIIDRMNTVSEDWIRQLHTTPVSDNFSFTDDETEARVAMFLLQTRQRVGMDRRFLVLHNELLARAAREPEWALQFMEINRQFVVCMGHILELMLAEVGRVATKRTEALAQAVIGIAMRYTGVSVWWDYLSEKKPTYQVRGTLLQLEDVLDLVVTLLFASSVEKDDGGATGQEQS